MREVSLAAITPAHGELDAAYEALRVALLAYRDAQDRFERAMLAVEAETPGGVNDALIATAARVGNQTQP